MRKLVLLSAAIFLFLTYVALTGCSSKPIDELNMVRTAMDQARSKQALEYAPLDWDRARSEWEEANALIQMGRYGEARNVLMLSVSSFNTARDAANRRLESLKLEVTALRTSVAAELSSLEQAAQDPKVKPPIRKKIDGALPLIGEKISVMDTALEEKEYLQARTAGKEVIRWIHSLRESMAMTR